MANGQVQSAERYCLAGIASENSRMMSTTMWLHLTQLHFVPSHGETGSKGLCFASFIYLLVFKVTEGVYHMRRNHIARSTSGMDTLHSTVLLQKPFKFCFYPWTEDTTHDKLIRTNNTLDHSQKAKKSSMHFIFPKGSSSPCSLLGPALFATLGVTLVAKLTGTSSF